MIRSTILHHVEKVKAAYESSRHNSLTAILRIGGETGGQGGLSLPTFEGEAAEPPPTFIDVIPASA